MTLSDTTGLVFDIIVILHSFNSSVCLMLRLTTIVDSMAIIQIEIILYITRFESSSIGNDDDVDSNGRSD
jgi:hypothetical protein